MEIKTMIGIGAGAVALGAGEAVTLWKVFKLSREVKQFNASVDEVTKNIDIDVPDKLVAVAMDRAATSEAEKAAMEVKGKASAIIQNSVDKVIEKEKGNVEKSVKAELERKINLVDIEDIKSKVVSEASLTIANDVMSNIPIISSGKNDLAGIIRACKDAGMTSWQIEQVINSVNR